MAPGIISPVPGTPLSPLYNGFGGSRQVSSASVMFESDSISQNGRSSRREFFMPRKFNGLGNSNITSVVQSLYRRSGDELGTSASARLLTCTHQSILEWIRHQRMSHLPPEGSSYDKVLGWAQLFVERLHSFEVNIQKFAGDSYLAAQLSYGYCDMLLQLGKENAAALMISFGFFYSTSLTLVNLLERTELFDVSQEIKEQLILALSDLVTLVASVSTHFHQVINDQASGSISVDIYNTFPGQINSFKDRCEKIAESMWRHQLTKEGVDAEKVLVVKSVKSWLAPEDRVLSHLAENTSHLAHEREEMTCLWMAPYLTHFLKSDKSTLSFTGKPGSGKTVLASVIVDRLQDPIGGVTYKTIFVPINARIPAETHPIAIAKTILSQLFEKRIGNVGLLQILGDAYERSRKATTNEDYENILWTALERALGAALRNAKELVIVVDGLDEAQFGESALLKKLTTATANATKVKLITLGSEKPSGTNNLLHVPITEDRIADDISIVVRANFEHSKVFQQMPEMEQETVIDKISEASQGSFLWAKLCSKRARNESSPENLTKAVDTVISSKISVSDFVLHSLSNPDISEDAKHMLLWLATADRPLQVRELAALSQVQPEKFTVADRKIEPLPTLKPLNSLVFLQDGQVYLRHGLIRTAVLDVFSKGKLTPTIKDRHADFVTRLLVYIKSTVPEQHEPTLTPLDRQDTHLLVQRYPLLDFAVRYWPRHLTQTTTYSTGGDAPTAKEYSKIFPANITLVLLQNTLWQYISTPTLLTYYTTVTNLCRHILTTNSPVTLQSLITLAFFNRDIGRFPEATTLFYELTTVSKTLLTTKSLITMKIASLFIELTTESVTTSKTDIMVRREEILQLLIETYKIHYGQTSERVVTTMNTLIEHYRLTKEEKKLQELTITLKGITTVDTGYENESRGDLHVHLKHQKRQDSDFGIRFVLDAEQDERESDSFDFQALIQLAQKYTAEGKVAEAERVYVEIWQRASKECRAQYSAQWEEIKLQAVTEYSQFLHTQKRETEASSILSSVWEEYRHSSLSLSESTTKHFHQIAKVMSAVGLTTAALSIFKQCSHYYQSTNSTQSSSYSELQQSISSTSHQVMKQASSSSSSVTSEETLEEIVYEAASSISKIDESSFTATSTLIERFVSQHRWKDATRVSKKVLQGLWPSLFAPSIQDVTLPSKHVEKCVDLAERLSQFYHFRRRFPREENIRIRVYRAVRSGRPVDDKLRERVTTELIRFYERSKQPDNVINIRQEILDDQVKHYGPEHPVVIKTLRTLAELTRPRPIFVEYYQRIIKALNKDAPVCKPEALEPLVIVTSELWIQSRYSEAVPFFTLLFTTFLDQPKSPRFQDTTFVQEIFEHYTHVLRTVRTEYSVIHKVTMDFQTKVKAVFGATASITIQATLTLAKVCQESKRYETDAINLYEELLKINSTEIDREDISATLDGIYEEQTAVLLHKSENVSSSQVERASKILRKRITTVRESHGWAHEESLSKLKEIVSFHSKHSESSAISKELKESTVNILTQEKSSTRLVSAAIAIASSYIETNQVSKATEMSEELYRQVVMKDTSNSKSSQFDVSKQGRQSLVFLAQLEHSLRKSTSSITEILASLTTEYVYFEEFRSLTTSKSSSFHSVSISASRLYQFLIRSNRSAAANRVFDDFVAYFISTEGKRTKLTDANQVKIFLLTIVDHFHTYTSSNFVRSVGIASNSRVLELLQAQRYDEASNLALAAFQYISADKSFGTPAIVKFVFTLGIFITGRTSHPQPDQATQKKLAGVSAVIIQEVLRVISDLKINLAQISLDYLNILIGLLGEQKEYKNLVWLLSGLWANRNVQNWSSTVTLGLARRYILARYLVGDALKAARLAEDIVYNCRRVNGARHTSTLEMSTLLSQLYTGIAQRYQAEKGGQHMANKYYKKSAGVHENLLRILIDPSFAEFEAGLDGSLSMDGSAYDLDISDSANGNTLPEGEHVRQHLNLLKLAVQRLGDWPKDYEEYKRLNDEVFLEFGADLLGVEGVEGVDKWDPKKFGGGKAQGSEDTLNTEIESWELDLGQNGEEVEEEL
ncbi:hypothetical protein N7532_008883 [Penicillium argentinense]|uniref:Nephrocystin 3-like N-terminal domain-containing protein n=1 Tax=Penicillium argentinense TaxID=1131581 RepID=A0A9W9EY90_9EURO|nr:uncharacterized protein N7532_008883 [Penicillium argentinense]KAJ5090199.1 hypothetical protein N7532_008883 [Penicillium argentinense]